MSTSPSAAAISVRRSSPYLLDDLRELVLDDPEDLRLVGEDRAEALDQLDELGVLLLDLAGLERGQALQAHVQDRLGLGPAELELVDQRVARDVGVGRLADQLDHRVEVVERDEEPLEDVSPGLGARQLVLGAAGDDVALVDDVVADRLEQAQRLRDAVDERDHVDAEALLHLGALVELVQHDLGGVAAALQLDHDAHPGAVGLVAQVRDAGDLLLAHQVGDLHDQAALAALPDLEGELGDDDRLLAVLHRLDVRLGADLHRPAARGVGVADALGAEDRAAAGEVGALDVLHQALEVDLGVVDEGVDRAGDLGQVVRRDVGRHADRDAGGAVDQQVREPRRQQQRLLGPLVVVRAEVDGVGVDVAEHLGRERAEARLGVPHRGCGVPVDRAEVALAVDQRVAQREVLRHPDERVVDGGVAVRVVLAHHLADDEGALPVRPVRLQAEVVHRVEDAAVHRLQAVADVGQRPAHDHAHRVVEVARAHLLLELAGLDVPGQRLEGGSSPSPSPMFSGSSA